MTYSKKQLKGRYWKGIFIGILVGGVVVFVGGQFVGVFDGFNEHFGDLLFSSSDEEQVSTISTDDADALPLSDEDLAHADASADEPLTDEEETDSQTDEVDEEAPSTPASDASPASPGVYTDTASGFSIDLPTGWTSATGAGITGLLAPGTTTTTQSVQEDADVLVQTRSKTASDTLEDYYDGVNAVNYYASATEGTQASSVDGYPAVTFKGVIGFTPSTITAIDLGGTIVEIHDPGQDNQSDGSYKQILSGFRAL